MILPKNEDIIYCYGGLFFNKLKVVKMKEKRTYTALAGIILLGLGLRFMGFSCSLPSKTGRLSTFHFDEYLTFDSIGKMNPAKLDFYPHTNITSWGTFQLYFQAGVLKAMQLAGVLRVESKEWLKKNLWMADRMYVSGRLVTMFFSSLSLVLLFLISRRLLYGWFALAPPLFLSLAYADIFMSSVVKPDVIMIFWGLCCFYAVLNLLEKGASARGVALAALFNGLSFSTKYTGFLFGFFFAVFITLEVIKKREYLKSLFLSGLYLLVCFLVFITVNPYFILRNSEVWAEMSGVSAKAGLIGPGGMLAGYAEFLTQILPFAVGWAFWLFSIAALVYAFVNRKKEIVISAVFALAYFLRLGYPHDQLFTYCLIAVPFLSLICGYFVQNTFSRGALYKILPAAVLLYSFSYSFYQKSRWNDFNTLLSSSAWIEGNVDKKSRVCLSRVEVWTPPALRKYETEWNLKTFSEPSETFEKGFAGLKENLGNCDYVLLTEMELQRIKLKPELSGLTEGVSSGFFLEKEFVREDNPFFINKSSRQALLTSFMNPNIYVYKAKK